MTQDTEKVPAHTPVTGLTHTMVCRKLSREGKPITKKAATRAICLILFAMAAPISVAVLADGCNTVQPPNQQVQDAQITTQVKAKLASDVRPSSLANIDVNTTNGVVTLAGGVESAEVKSKAETVTASVSGVVRVNNNLQVVPAAASVGH